MTSNADGQLRSTIPTFRVSDARASEVFYSGKLGFRTTWTYDPGDGSPVFLEIMRDNVALHLSEHEGDGPKGVSIYVNVADARALCDEFLAVGVKLAEPLYEAEWGEVVFSLTDFDGNTMRFGSPAP